MKTIIFTLSAAKDFDALSKDAREQVEAGLHRYALTGQGDVKALQGHDGYRLRIGTVAGLFLMRMQRRSWQSISAAGPRRLTKGARR